MFPEARTNLVGIFESAVEQRVKQLFPTVGDSPGFGRAGTMAAAQPGALFGVHVKLVCSAMQLQTLTSARTLEGFLSMRAPSSDVELRARLKFDKPPQQLPQQWEQEQPFQRVYWLKLTRVPLRVTTLGLEDMGKILASAGLSVTAIRPVMRGSVKVADSVMVAVRSPRHLQGHGTLNLSGLAPGVKVPVGFTVLQFPQLPPLASMRQAPMQPAASSSAPFRATPPRPPSYAAAAAAPKTAMAASTSAIKAPPAPQLVEGAPAAALQPPAPAAPLPTNVGATAVHSPTPAAPPASVGTAAGATQQCPDGAASTMSIDNPVPVPRRSAVESGGAAMASAQPEAVRPVHTPPLGSSNATAVGGSTGPASSHAMGAAAAAAPAATTPAAIESPVRAVPPPQQGAKDPQEAQSWRFVVRPCGDCP